MSYDALFDDYKNRITEANETIFNHERRIVGLELENSQLHEQQQKPGTAHIDELQARLQDEEARTEQLRSQLDIAKFIETELNREKSEA